MKAAFIALLGLISTAHAELREWQDYRAILWMSGAMEKHREQWPLIAQRLREMGVNTGMGHRDAPPQPLLNSGFSYYVENIINQGLCLKFSSKVTNWSKFIDEWSKTRSADAFVRDYCFDDPKWLGWATDVMSKTAAAHAASKPLMYDLRDELSVTTSANPFDYDFSPLALTGFRDWLKTQYQDLTALNQQWDTGFNSWEAVMPFSTDQIKARMVTGEKHPQREPDWSALKHVKFDPAEAAKQPARWNFSPWCDHRTYMDLSLARTLDQLRQTSHASDPATPVGIEGLQMPHAFGGYDLWRLSQVLDWCEPYDAANSREILGSFMADKPMVCTVFEKDTKPALRRLWHLLLLGDRGCSVWWSDDVIDWSKPDLPLTDKGKALAPVLKEMTSPLAKLFLKAKREFDPVAIHYSQPSIQVAWLLESTIDGKTWPRRFSSFEATHNQHAQVRNSWLKLLQDLGYSPGFANGPGIQDDSEPDNGAIFPGASHSDASALIVPRSWALSPVERKWIDQARGRLINVVDGTPGFFDAHGKFSLPANWKRSNASEPQLRVDQETGAGLETVITQSSLDHYAVDRLSARFDPSAARKIAKPLAECIGPPRVRVPIEARVRTHRFTLGKARLLAFERNIDYKMSEELAQAGGNEQLEKPVTFTATWNGEKHVVDLRTGQTLGRTASIEVHLEPWQPSLYALTDEPLAVDAVQALLQQAP